MRDDFFLLHNLAYKAVKNVRNKVRANHQEFNREADQKLLWKAKKKIDKMAEIDRQ